MYHHACVGGLLEHSLDIARQVVVVSRRYKELDRDLVATVALLHDIGKIESYERKGGMFDFTDVGRLLGHIYVGAARVEQAISRIEGFPEELRLRVVHAILAHHGEPAKGSPVSVGKAPIGILIHEDKLLVANNGAGTISVFRINFTSWALIPVQGSPFKDPLGSTCHLGVLY